MTEENGLETDEKLEKYNSTYNVFHIVSMVKKCSIKNLLIKLSNF